MVPDFIANALLALGFREHISTSFDDGKTLYTPGWHKETHRWRITIENGKYSLGRTSKKQGTWFQWIDTYPRRKDVPANTWISRLLDKLENLGFKEAE